jgi:FkbM family methyltransferase
MKVLIVSVFPPDPAPEANHALHLSEHLAAAGLEVDVLCKKGSVDRGLRPGVVLRPVMNDWTWSDLPLLIRSLRASRPDVVLLLYIGWVYGHHPMITFLPTICHAVLPGVPCVTQFENVDTSAPPQSLRAGVLRKVVVFWARPDDVHPVLGTLLRDSARIIALSSPHQARLVSQDPAVHEKSVIVPPPPLIRLCADPSTARRRAREAVGAAQDDFVLVFWGFVYPGKGLETLLEAFRIVADRHPTMRLVIVGGNLEVPPGSSRCREYFKMVHELPEKLGIADRVTWTGHFDWDSDAGSLYLHAGDLCILPFDYGVTLNNSSLAAASTHGLPVIATELPTGRDEALDHGQNVYLCRPRDPRMLAEAIDLMTRVPAVRERVRAGILRLAHDWHCWETTTRRIVSALESAASSPTALGPREVRANDAHLSASGWSEADPVGHEEHTPLVSVIVAAYNVGRYLGQCLESLVHQTLTNIEIVVVDDASQDGTALIINEYKSRYPKLVRAVMCEHNKGLASVRNIGMKVARGQYIAFTDGDDWADIRMCEVMHQRARADNADVVIADATVFYEDSKTFGQFFDQPLRQTLDPELRTRPFELSRDGRVMLLEPVAWTKLYRRSFLEKHALRFEDGMNSYEDICFHVSVLLKAARISLLDTALFFYRQNRPGQISGRTDRRVFEVFAVFDRIHKNLAAWNVSADIWALVTKIQLRQFDWLLKDRVAARHKQKFFALASGQLRMLPASGVRAFARQASPAEWLRMLCMRRNRFRTYETAVRSAGLLPRLLHAIVYNRRHFPRSAYRHGLRALRRRLAAFERPARTLVDLARLERRLDRVDDRLNPLACVPHATTLGDHPLVEVCRIGDQTLFLSRSDSAGLWEAVRRMQSDYYLLQMAIVREGDSVIDIGAHIGAMSIYLARKYPFITVYAVEPEPTNYEHLRRNIELNGVTNVIAINKALSDDGRRRTLYASGRVSTWATIDPGMATSQSLLRTVQVDSMTLQQLFEDFRIAHCRILKITAPGAAYPALNSFRRSGTVDLLCGEVDVEECSRPGLEEASWRIARQHFWRTVARRANGTVSSWLHQGPTEIDRLALHKTLRRRA